MIPWTSNRFLTLNALALAAVVLLALVRRDLWGMALALVLGDILLLVATGLWPRSTLLGPNLVRLPAAAAQRGEVAITIDDGPDPEVTPQVLAILEAYDVRASFFCIGARAAAHPELCQRIVQAGHCIENHGQLHRWHAAFFGYRGWLREVGAAQQTLARITGRRPRFFRALAGLRNPCLEPALAQFDLRLATWTRRGFDTVQGDAQRVLQQLLGGLAAGDILLLHDGNSARTAAGRPVIVEVLPVLLQELRARGLRPVSLEAACAQN